MADCVGLKAGSDLGDVERPARLKHTPGFTEKIDIVTAHERKTKHCDINASVFEGYVGNITGSNVGIGRHEIKAMDLVWDTLRKPCLPATKVSDDSTFVVLPNASDHDVQRVHGPLFHLSGIAMVVLHDASKRQSSNTSKRETERKRYQRVPSQRTIGGSACVVCTYYFIFSA